MLEFGIKDVSYMNFASVNCCHWLNYNFSLPILLKFISSNLLDVTTDWTLISVYLSYWSKQNDYNDKYSNINTGERTSFDISIDCNYT
jgi:hypothetical protein